MKQRKSVCLLLALLMLTAAFLAACSGDGGKDPVSSGNSGTAVTDPSGTPVTSAPAPETEPPDPDTVHDLPADLDFDGASFKMASTENWSCLRNDYSGEIVNDTKYEVKCYAQDLLNVDVEENFEIMAGNSVGSNIVLNYVLSGETEVQVFNMLDRDAAANTLEEIFLPISRMRYVDLSKKYWGSQAAEKLSFGDYQFLALDSFQLNSLNRAGCIFMNLTVAENYNLEVPYDLVADGKWTFDALKQYDGVVQHDVDGDGKLTHEDVTTFGSYDCRQVLLNVMSGADVPFIEKDEDNLPVCTCFGNEKLIGVMEWTKALFFNPTTAVSGDEQSMMYTQDMFVHDRQLFLTSKLGMMALSAEMDSVFAVFPYPKYDEAQENYVARAVDAIFPMVINSIEEETADMVGAVLEAMSAYAYQELFPAVVEKSLQFRYNNDPRSTEFIKLVYDSRTIELSDMFVWDIFGDTPTGRLMLGDKAPATWLASIQSKAENILDDYIDDIRYLVKNLK